MTYAQYPTGAPPVSSHPASISLPIRDKRMEDLLLWRNPQKSAAVFGGASAAYFLINHASNFSLVVITANILLVTTLACLLWNLVGHFFRSAGPPVPRVLREGISEEDARVVAEKLRGPLNQALSVVSRVVTGQDPKFSALVFVGLYVAKTIFARVSPLTLAYTVVLLAFTVPKLYEARKEDADKVMSIVEARYSELYAKLDNAVLKKIPKAKKLQ